jgi:hypothetical protein
MSSSYGQQSSLFSHFWPSSLTDRTLSLLAFVSDRYHHQLLLLLLIDRSIDRLIVGAVSLALSLSRKIANLIVCLICCRAVESPNKGVGVTNQPIAAKATGAIPTLPAAVAAYCCVQ